MAKMLIIGQQKVDGKLVGTPVRCNFPNLDAPKVFDGKEDQAKYGITLLIPKKDKETIKKILDFITAQVESVGTWKKAKKDTILKIAKDHMEGTNKFCILKDGDVLNDLLVADDKAPRPEQAGHYVLNVKNKRAPQVVDQSKNEIVGAYIASSIRSGYWVNAAVTAYTWDGKESQGVALQLQGVQLVKTDTEFGRMECDFDEIESEETEDDDKFE